MLDMSLVNLTHEQQQEAVEKIQALMREGVSSGEAIAYVAAELRAAHQTKKSIGEMHAEDESEK